MDLSDEDVRAIIRLLDASAFDELELETDAFRLSLRRVGGGFTQERTHLETPRLLDRTPAVAADVTPPAKPAAVAGTVAVHSPLPGTFYRAPKPGAPPFVELGTRVEPHTVVAIVETMKLMNSVCAGAAGVVAEICVKDGEMLPQNAVLLRIRPEAP
jgi:acetyl-CoA carboxylase biotin carboxyl carrier protein